jgi:hypothetical protein
MQSLAASRSVGALVVQRHQQQRVVVRAMPVSAALTEGQKVKVKSPVKVYHVGKFKGGLELQGMEGTVVADVRDYQGIRLSANLPIKVQFGPAGPDGKPVKVLAHLVSWIAVMCLQLACMMAFCCWSSALARHRCSTPCCYALAYAHLSLRILFPMLNRKRMSWKPCKKMKA